MPVKIQPTLDAKTTLLAERNALQQELDKLREKLKLAENLIPVIRKLALTRAGRDHPELNKVLRDWDDFNDVEKLMK